MSSLQYIQMTLVMDSVLRVVDQHVHMALKSFSRSHTQDIQMTLVMRSVFRARCHKNVMASSSMFWARFELTSWACFEFDVLGPSSDAGGLDRV